MQTSQFALASSGSLCKLGNKVSWPQLRPLSWAGESGRAQEPPGEGQPKAMCARASTETPTAATCYLVFLLSAAKSKTAAPTPWVHLER